MANGSFLTSQLPISSNVVTTDRIVIVWNAIANVSIGSGSPQTMTITMTDFVNSSLSTIKSSIFTSGSLSFGNSTVNTAINSTSLYIQTNLGTVFAVNTSGAIVGNGAGLTSLPSAGSNTQLLFNNSGSTTGDANLTWNKTSALLTIGNSSINTAVNSSVFVNGNTYINSTTLSVGNSGTVLVGNVTHNTVITPQSMAVSNNGNTVWSVGGTGAASLLTSLTVGNSTVNTTANASAIYFQSNTTANSIHSNVNIIFNSNATVNSSLSATSLSIANSTASLSLNPASFGVVNTPANGTFSLPGGWHIAFGLAPVPTTAAGANTVVTFANAFSSNAYSVTLSVISNSTFAVTQSDRAHVNAVTASGFTIYTGNSSASSNVGIAGIYYTAIGF